MIEKILEQFEDGQYDGPNGAKLYLLDMQEVQEYIKQLEAIID